MVIALLAFFVFPLTATAQQKTLGLIKKLNGNDENGYVLFSPIGVDTVYLINKCGQKVHYWKTEYTPGFTVILKPNGNLLKAGTYTDTSFGAAGGRGGMLEEYDWNGNLIWKYKLFNDSLCQHHDIRLMPNGNVMVLAWHAISKNKAISLGRDQLNFSGVPELWGERIIEFKPIGSDSAEIVWQWDLFDHVIQDRDSTLPGFGVVGQHPELMNINYALDLKTADWIHANSIDYNAALDQIVISAHNISEIWIIDHSTTTAEAATHAGGTFNKGGDFLYRWGNPAAYDNGSSADRKLFRQHNANWIPDGYREAGSIMVFNNGWGRDTAYSSIDIIKTPVLSNGSYVATLPYGPAKPAWQYTDSVKTRFYSQVISGANMLPNGNVLICSGVQGRLFEVNANRKIVWEYRNPVNTNGTQRDGQFAGNNQVFRCTFYGKSYNAFSGKSLASMGTLERLPYPYSCNYENTPPKVIAVLPGRDDSAVNPNAVLKVIFDEAVLKRSGMIQIYQNGIIKENIGVNSDLVKIKKDTMFISTMNAFAVNSRISVKVAAAIVRDSSNNNLLLGIDSSEWFFNTIKIRPLITSVSPKHLSSNVKPDTKITITFNENIQKRDNMSFRIYENGAQLEQVSISSPRINVSGNQVELSQLKPFKPNSLIVIGMDSCFMDSFGTVSPDIKYGDWYFRVASEPVAAVLFPAHQEREVNVVAKLILTLNRDVVLDSIRPVRIWENGVLKATIMLNDASVTINNAVVEINHGLVFKPNSRIAVDFPGNCLRDSFGLYFKGQDSTLWNFNTENSSGIIGIGKGYFVSVYPVPNSGSMQIKSSEEITALQVSDINGRVLNTGLHKNQDNTYTLLIDENFKGLCSICINGIVYAMVLVE